MAAPHALDLFATYAAQPLDARGPFVFAHPALLAQAALAAIAATAPAGNDALAYGDLAAFRAKLDAGGKFPLGTFPIESAAQAFFRGEIALDEALRRAQSPEVVSPIAYPYMRALCEAAVSLAGQKPHDALTIMELILAATEAADETPEAFVARTRAGMDFITVATPVLADVPDGRVYRRAMDVGAWLETRPERLALWPPGELAFRIGVLNLDPYLFDGDVANYTRSLNAWRNRFVMRLGPSLAGLAPAGIAMPEPAAALAIAVERLTEAAATQTGDSQVYAQKALSQAIALQEAIVGTSTATAGAIASAAALTVPADLAHADPSVGLRALQAARSAGTVTPADAERLILTLPAPDDLVARGGAQRAVQAALDALVQLAELGSAAGLAFAERYRALVFGAGTSADQRAFLMREVLLFATDTSVTGPDSPAALARMLEAAQREGGERDVLAAIDRLSATSPNFAAAHADALGFLQYLGYTGLAKNAYDAQQWGDAIQNDGIALSYCLRCGFLDEATENAARIEGLADHDGPGVPAAVAVTLMACALRYEALAGPEAMRFVRSVVTKAVTGMLRAGSLNTRVYGTLMLAGIATRLGAALRSGAQLDPSGDAEAAALLEGIAAAEHAIGPQFGAFDGEEILLASFVEAEDRETGSDPVARLRNLQRAFDARIDARIAGRAADLRPSPFTLDELHAVLDDRTVLLHYFLGATPDGRVATVVLLVTKDDAEIAVIAEQLPAALIKEDLGGGVSGYMPPLGVVVQERRRQVMMDAVMRVVDRDGGEALAADSRRLLGPFVEKLAALRAAGKSALTIVPHGPLHFYPWAVLGGPDRPLGADWAITIAPSLGFVLATPAAGPRVKTERSSIGLSFAPPNPHGYSELKSSGPEARAVAAAVDVPPVLDGAATKAVVLAALRRSRSVHISTHGRHAVAAPGFQFIVCADEGAIDGRLFAHEVLGEDLRGLELLTLSACETALGRYDLGDNLRGLPAAFFLAGVQTIVATLWEVSSAATATFFPVFYTAIAAGAAPRDAFAAALKKTRTDHPAFNDWGAFYFMGRPA